ncbi:MAG: hypothetical protein ACOCXM_11750 [Myxococcota bacterium]
MGWFRRLGLLSAAFALVALLFTSNVGCVVRSGGPPHSRGVKRGHHKQHKAKKANKSRGRGKKKGHRKGRGNRKRR